MMHPSGAARCPVIAAGLSQRAGRAWIRISDKLQDAGVGTVAARKPRRLRIDLMRVVSGLLLPAVAYLARRKTRWDYSKCHKRRRQARRARFAPILDLRASLPKTGTDDSHKLAAPNPDPANAGNPK